MTEDNSQSEDMKHSRAFKNMVEAWADTLNWVQNRAPYIPTIGPSAGFVRNSSTITAELAKASEEFTEFNKVLAQYYAKISVAWMEAIMQVMAQSPMDLMDEKSRDKVKKIWIDTFEEQFTNLFDSEDFATVFGKLLKHEVQFNNHVKKLVEMFSENLDMPRRSEIETVYEEIERIKKKLKRVSDAIEEMSGGKKKDLAKVL